MRATAARRRRWPRSAGFAKASSGRTGSPGPGTSATPSSSRSSPTNGRLPMAPDSMAFQIATWLIPLVFAIVLHEISHGWVASAFGDPTAREEGRLSLNPVRHVDPVGTVVLPMVLAVSGAPVFGWARPVPVVAERMRNPRLHMMLVALAGPGM